MTAANEQIATDPTAGMEVHRPDDRFVPVRACELVEALAADEERFGADAPDLARVAGALRDVIEQEAHCFDRRLCDQYARFNPDRDTVPQEDLDEVRTPAAYAELRQALVYLFDKANFEELSEVQIGEAVRTANSYGLRVRLDPERVEELAIWVRGRTTAEMPRRDWKGRLRGLMRDTPVYRRMAVCVRLKGSPHVILKLFKEIPVQDVQALLPHAEIRMGWFDRLMVLGGGAGTLGSTAAKVFSSAGTVLALSKLFWVLILGLGTLAFRTFMGYRRARRNSDSQRTRHLYYQNLTNNAGVLHSLISMIAQEELKEAVLAYAFCQAADGPARTTAGDLKARIDAYLGRRFRVETDFDLPDALETIGRLELWQPDGPWQVLPPKAAVAHLEDHWRHRRSQDYHQRGCRGAPPPPAGGGDPADGRPGRT